MTRIDPVTVDRVGDVGPAEGRSARAAAFESRIKPATLEGALPDSTLAAVAGAPGQDAPSAPRWRGKRGQQVRRWLERRGRRAVRPLGRRNSPHPIASRLKRGKLRPLAFRCRSAVRQLWATFSRSPDEAEVLFTLLAERYERRSPAGRAAGGDGRTAGAGPPRQTHRPHPVPADRVVSLSLSCRGRGAASANVFSVARQFEQR